MPILTTLRAPFRGSRRREIFLDGEKWDDTAAAVVKELSLREADDVDPDSLARRILDAEPAAARERAYRLLRYRDHGIEELRRKLTDDGYHCRTVSTLIDSFVGSGLLDDERFAAVLARTLVLGRGIGRSRAKRELLQRGLDVDLVTATLDLTCPEDDEYDRAYELAKRWVRPSTDARKLAARLIRKGYSPNTAFRVSSEVLTRTGHDTPESDW